jgi:nephrocystin-4
VRGIVQDFLSSEKILNSFFGKAELVPFVFKNPTASPNTYEIQIKDPDQPYLSSSELSLISNPAEWRFWCHFKGLPEPYSYDMIKYSDLDDRKFYYFYLEGNEEVTLLFKFLSFRRVDVNLQFDPDAFEFAQQRGKEFIQKYIYPRHIEIKLLRRDNRQLVTELRVRIEPHMQVVDHVLRYYERDNRQTKIILPPLYTFT